MGDLPLWLSTDQVERLKAALESSKFENVRVTSEGPKEIRVTASFNGAEHFVRVGESNLMTTVVWQFRKWRQRLG